MWVKLWMDQGLNTSPTFTFEEQKVHATFKLLMILEAA